MNKYEQYLRVQWEEKHAAVATGRRRSTEDFSRRLREAYDIAVMRDIYQSTRTISISNGMAISLWPDMPSVGPQSSPPTSPPPSRDRAAHREREQARTGYCAFRAFVGYGQGTRRRS